MSISKDCTKRARLEQNRGCAERLGTVSEIAFISLLMATICMTAMYEEVSLLYRVAIRLRIPPRDARDDAGIVMARNDGLH